MFRGLQIAHSWPKKRKYKTSVIPRRTIQLQIWQQSLNTATVLSLATRNKIKNIFFRENKNQNKSKKWLRHRPKQRLKWTAQKPEETKPRVGAGANVTGFRLLSGTIFGRIRSFLQIGRILIRSANRWLRIQRKCGQSLTKNFQRWDLLQCSQGKNGDTQ